MTDWADRAAEEIYHGVQCGGTGDFRTYRMLTQDEMAAVIRRHADACPACRIARGEKVDPLDYSGQGL